ncbi:NAD(P)/FAD-dependent oxidoreductase [Fulvimonas soli]|jgi:NADH dehydrogenase|uniref:NADH dehydrogenase FAD-containing subunit n=1 Tax=Fulvimonas soli TaxID=155197 RepID=A0A316HU05_9GAMM|nr:NAD(P)/FAD-dependent oxidoreductase [Fulvimonas soli]PWK83919.1 NADH dehydrogenase FAD-containing subunit [Fulvimonas soli]TNY25344.1 FAD-dependent oxidoreductase [Fulvimonas soli]
MAPDTQAHVVILGGGFGGLAAARALAGAPVRVTLVDRRNHHLFQPLLYQVATAGLSAPSIAAPLRHILRRQANATVLLDEVVGVEPDRRRVRLAQGPLDYDYLVVATGATHAYFGHDDWAPHAPGLKTLDDAFEIRRRVLLAFEQAEREDDPARRQPWLDFVVVGGGATGVELAGTLAEIARHTLPREFRRADPRRAEVLLVEAGPRLLPAFDPALSEKARRQLEALGVRVRTGAAVTAVDARGVTLGGERVEARTVLWAAGVAASPVGRMLGAPCDRAGRVQVMPDLSLPGHPEVFVIGDLASVARPDGRPVPGVAPAAKQMGRYVAARIRARLRGEAAAQPFRYRDQGTLATIGRMAAVAQFGRVKLSGLPAWWVWLLAHAYFLIGFRNRLVVLLDWAWSYWTYQRHARVVAEGPPALTGGAAPAE